MSLQIVQSVRSKYPTPLGDQHAAFLQEVAGVLGLGLVAKTSGTRIKLPSGVEVSQDVVMNTQGAAWDILSDGEGEAKPVFNQIDPIDPTRFVPVATTTGPTGPANPTNTVDIDKIISYMKEIFGEVQGLRSDIDMLRISMDSQAADVDNLKAQLELSASEIHTTLDRIYEVQHNTFYKGKVAGFSLTLNPEVRV